MAGGCFRSNISIGLGAETHNWLVRHILLEQHSGSAQSMRPSEKGVLIRIKIPQGIYTFANNLKQLSSQQASFEKYVQFLFIYKIPI